MPFLAQFMQGNGKREEAHCRDVQNPEVPQCFWDQDFHWWHRWPSLVPSCRKGPTQECHAYHAICALLWQQNLSLTIVTSATTKATLLSKTHTHTPVLRMSLLVGPLKRAWPKFYFFPWATSCKMLPARTDDFSRKRLAWQVVASRSLCCCRIRQVLENRTVEDWRSFFPGVEITLLGAHLYSLVLSDH